MIENLKRSPVEYKVLGRSTVNVDGQQLSLDVHLGIGNVVAIENVLNTLGKEGWEIVKLEYPYVFKRSISKMEVEIGELAAQLTSRS